MIKTIYVKCITLILLKMDIIGIIKHKNIAGRRLQFKQPICIIISLKTFAYIATLVH